MHQKQTKHTCCELCQYYWTCEKKWYRGEKRQENICCDLCTNYSKCWGQASKKTVKK